MTRLLLVGAGHAHLSVLRAFRDAPPAAAEVVLLTPHPRQLYSGMLPGWVAGHYSLDQCAIPLAPLLAGGRINVVAAHLAQLDLAQRVAISDRGHRIAFDLVSLDTGPVADLDALPGLRHYGLAVRPLERFVTQWQQWQAVTGALARSGGELPTLTVIGGGAGGIELALAAAWRARVSGPTQLPMRVQLVTGRAGLLPDCSARVRALVRDAVRRMDLRLIEDDAVEVGAETVLLAEGGELASSHTLAATGASAAAWPREAGLAVDARGFIETDAALRSTSHPFVFAAGDCATIVGEPRPKSGVYAVRAGPPLADNLRRALRGDAPQPWKPQPRALYLLATGPRHAIARWGELGWQGAWVWRWKDRIDRRFVGQFGARFDAGSSAAVTS